MAETLPKVRKSKMGKLLDVILSFVFITIFGWVIFMKLSPEFALVIMVIGACAGLIWVLRKQKTRDMYNRIGQSYRKGYIPICVILVVGLALIMVFPLRAGLITYATPEAPEVLVENAFINQTNEPTTPYFLPYKYRLLVEFGARRYDIPFDVSLDIGRPVSSMSGRITAWWDKPELTNRSSDAIYPFDLPFQKSLGSGVSVGMMVTDIKEDTISPIYRLSFGGVPISPSRSLYLYFESTEPLSIETAVFANKTFHAEGMKLIPEKWRNNQMQIKP